MDVEEDVLVLYPEYSKHWDFWDEYVNLNYIDFQMKLYGLGGIVKELISLRSRYINGSKMSKEEKIGALKSLNQKQIDYLEQKRLDNEVKVKKVVFETLVSKQIEDILSSRGKKGSSNGDSKHSRI